jgi:hypothetical protein
MKHGAYGKPKPLQMVEKAIGSTAEGGLGASGIVPDGAFAVLEQLLRWLLVAEHELLLFSAFWFAISAVDEISVDL